MADSFHIAVAELLEAAEVALGFIDDYRDMETDPASDIGEQVPNRACRIYAQLQEAAELAGDEYDAITERAAHETAVCRAEYMEER